MGEKEYIQNLGMETTWKIASWKTEGCEEGT
jgi:hypothetical protein